MLYIGYTGFMFMCLSVFWRHKDRRPASGRTVH